MRIGRNVEDGVTIEVLNICDGLGEKYFHAMENWCKLMTFVGREMPRHVGVILHKVEYFWWLIGRTIEKKFVVQIVQHLNKTQHDDDGLQNGGVDCRVACHIVV